MEREITDILKLEALKFQFSTLDPEIIQEQLINTDYDF